MKRFIYSLFLACFALSSFSQEEIRLIAKDGVHVTGDYYTSKTSGAPLILLFHQAGYSRGEYRAIATQLTELGYNCMAIDQRSGNKVNGVTNKTKESAVALGKATNYTDAYPDLEIALLHATDQLGFKKVTIWGSSYSSSLVFILASKYPKRVNALLSFSPGEYFSFEGKKIQDFAAKVKCPVFITSAKNEKGSWASIYSTVKGKKLSFLPEGKGFHGSKALWEDKEGHEEYWTAVKAFLKNNTK